MRRVVLDGKPLRLSGIRATLERRTGLGVVFYDPAVPGVTERLSELRPRSRHRVVEGAAPIIVAGVDLAKDQALSPRVKYPLCYRLRASSS